MRFTRTILTGAAALALLAGPALAQPAPYQHPGGPPGAPPPHEYHGPEGGPPHQDDYHGGYHHGPSGPHGQWARGDQYDGHRYVVYHGDWDRYHLHPPPHGYEWVRSGNQFIMVAIASGIIASVIANSAY